MDIWFLSILLTIFVVFSILLVCAFILFTGIKRPVIVIDKEEKYFINPEDDNKKVPFPSVNDDATLDLSIIVPSYNEEDRLPVMLNEAMDYLIDRKKSDPDFSYEIIIVDDGSKDKTTEVGLMYSEKYSTDRVRVLTLVKNRGKGGAIRIGILSCRGEQVLFADADGATHFSDIQKLEKQLTNVKKGDDNRAIVCGSRAHLSEQAVAERSLFRTILMYGFHFCVWFLCVRGIQDTQCGFKLLTRQAARVVFNNLHVERWAFDVDMIYIAQYLSIPVCEVAVRWQEIEGTKMVPFWSWLQMGRDLLLIRLHYMLGAWTIEDKPKVD